MKRPVVLIVDDEEDARSTLLEFLKGRYDCDFKEAPDGESAVNFIKSNPCDVMLLDIKMPKKGGMEVIKEAKALRPGIDILIISGWVSEEVAEDAVELGATDYAVKPFDLKAISIKLTHMLERRGQLAPKRQGV